MLLRILAVKVVKYLEWNDLTWRDDGRQEIERLHATNNFPEFTGRSALPRARTYTGPRSHGVRTPPSSDSGLGAAEMHPPELRASFDVAHVETGLPRVWLTPGLWRFVFAGKMSSCPSLTHPSSAVMLSRLPGSTTPR